jgi:hypothetical protein
MMIHILTVHWQNDSWIDIQLEYLRKHITSEYRVYAYLNGIEEDHSSKFYYSSTEPIQEHATKLNLLAEEASRQALGEGDILVFLDGDAFPIAQLDVFLDAALSNQPLVAVQRLENLGDPQPHPCFCATTVAFWQSIDGDWEKGHQWKNQAGELVTDVGGNLMGKLEAGDVKWTRLLRSNTNDVHPLWFGIYGNIIYHHGAGFRPARSRLDFPERSVPVSVWQRLISKMHRLLNPNYIDPRESARIKKVEQVVDSATRLGKQVTALISSDEHFYRYFISGDQADLEEALCDE